MGLWCSGSAFVNVKRHIGFLVIPRVRSDQSTFSYIAYCLSTTEFIAASAFRKT
jgi:hypothetical protein